MTDACRAPRSQLAARGSTALVSRVSTNTHLLLALKLGLSCGSLLCQLLFLLLLLDYVRVVVERLIKLQLLHLLAILYFLVLRDAMLIEFLTEEVVVEELLGGLLRVGTSEDWLECGGCLALRGSCFVLSARSLK